MINVSETFLSIQGEGISRGKPAVFIRMPHCNLMCQGRNWKCDSLAVRTKFKPFTERQLLDKILDMTDNMRVLLKKGRVRFIFTGGEPGLEENSKMINFFLTKLPFKILHEVETNGSVGLNKEYKKMLSKADVVNCSPKLESSGNALIKRFNKETLDFINNLSQSYFKFVVDNEDDLKEIEQRFDFVHEEKIILMPATHNVLEEMEEDIAWKQYIWNLAAQKGWMYSAREHIDVWKLKAGV